MTQGFKCDAYDKMIVWSLKVMAHDDNDDGADDYDDDDDADVGEGERVG